LGRSARLLIVRILSSFKVNFPPPEDGILPPWKNNYLYTIAVSKNQDWKGLLFQKNRRYGKILKNMELSSKKKYLQIAFNRNLDEVISMVEQLPCSPNIILEAGTPFVKKYGINGISTIKETRENICQTKAYIVADLKTMDRGEREVKEAKKAGASAVTCLGTAPIETIDAFLESCEKYKIDGAIDMLGVKFPFEVLQKLKKMPKIIILHLGVDERRNNREKIIPYHQINRIKGTYGKVLIAIAGGENPKDVLRAFFNDADIAIIWEKIYQNPKRIKEITLEFLKNIKK